MKMKVYLDYAASTPLKKEVLEVMMPYLTNTFGNASSVHGYGRDLSRAVEKSRRTLAALIGANKDEIYFTSGGTESNNWALKGIAYSHKDKGKHIVTCKTEHPAIINTCKYLESEGYEVTYLDVDSNGLISIDELKNSLREDTILVSVMFINNEIGCIQPIKEIGLLCKEKNIYFHTDAVQGFGNVDINVKDINIDLMSLSSHKIYGPTGVGALYIKKGIKIKSLLSGGAQERNRRAGTSNVSAIVGFSKAAELVVNDLEAHVSKLKKYRDMLLEGLEKNLEGVTLNGDRFNRHPGNINLSFEGISEETLLMNLDLAGIACSAGSACSSGSLEASHVLLAIGLDNKKAKSSVRMSVGSFTTEEEINYVVDELTKIILRIRGINKK